MATQRPLSTINYCSEKFTVHILHEWIKQKRIQYAMYICHIGEDGDKDHMHLFVFPNKRLDPMDLKEELKEVDPNHVKMKGTLSWHLSTEEDWLLYGYHNKDYLRLHEELKEANSKIEYSLNDIKVVGDFDIEELHLRALAKMKKGSSGIYGRLKKGENAQDLISQGVSPTLIGQILHACPNILSSDKESSYLKVIAELIKYVPPELDLKSFIPESICKELGIHN